MKDSQQKLNYTRIAEAIGFISENPVAYLIPCNCVNRASDEICNYHWGEIRKNAIIGLEAAKIEI